MLIRPVNICDDNSVHKLELTHIPIRRPPSVSSPSFSLRLTIVERTCTRYPMHHHLIRDRQLMRQHAMLCRLFSLQKHCILDIRYIEEGSRKDQGAQATAWLRSCSPREPHLVHWGRFIDTHTHMYRRWPCSSIRLAAHEDDGKAQRCNRGKAGHVYCDRACDCI